MGFHPDIDRLRTRSTASTGKDLKRTGRMRAMQDEAPTRSLEVHVVRFTANDKELDVVRVPSHPVQQCLMALFEKRGSTREVGMEKLVGLLERFVYVEEFEHECSTIVSRCIFSFKKGSVRESCLAYRAVGALALVLSCGVMSKEILVKAFPFLVRTVQASADTARVLAALDSLVVATFAGAEDEDDMEESMEAIWCVIDPSPNGAASETKPPPVVAAAVSAWAFLLITLLDRSEQRPDASWRYHIAHLTRLLDASDRAVRMAAGKALAACIELELTHDTSPDDMEALEDTVSDLAGEAGGKGVGKNLLVEQRDLFRQIETFMAHGICPRETVQTSSKRESAFKVATWAKLIQLSFLKRFLGNGFLSHLQGNELFQETFNIVDEEDKAIEARRRKLSKKRRDVELRRCRDIVWEMKNKFELPEMEAPESDMPVERFSFMLPPAPPVLMLGYH